MNNDERTSGGENLNNDERTYGFQTSSVPPKNLVDYMHKYN